jgi:hypothetical protein
MRSPLSSRRKVLKFITKYDAPRAWKVMLIEAAAIYG